MKKVKRRSHKWISWFVVAALFMGECSFFALAEESDIIEEEDNAGDETDIVEEDITGDEVDSVEGDDADDEADTTEEDDIIEEDNAAEEVICICGSMCSEEMVNMDCPVCAESYVNCTGRIVDADAEIMTDEGIETYDWRDNFEENGVLYSKIRDGEVKVTGHTDAAGTEVVIPETVRGFTVTEIEDKAFFQYADLKTVEIPGSVVSIGKFAFAESGLESLTIPDSVISLTSIGAHAFAACTALTDIKIPDSVVSIGKFAFSGSGLESLTIPDSVTSIGEYAFQNCKMESLVVPKSFITERTEKGIFDRCMSLSKVTIADGAELIPHSMFSNCLNLKEVSIPESVTVIDNSAFLCCYNLEEITIPDGVTEIGSSAFEGSGLKSPIIPDRVTKIGQSAFSYCANLTSIRIPRGVTKLELGIFTSCGQLGTVEISDSVYYIGESAFLNCTSLTTLKIYTTRGGENFMPPTVEVMTWGTPFENCADSRSLSFVGIDGNELTGEEADKIWQRFDEADGEKDNLWYGWKFGKSNVSTNTEITINVQINGGEWTGHHKTFALKLAGSTDAALITGDSFSLVSDGEYDIYDITDAAAGVDTGVNLTVSDGSGTATVNYYTVTFYDGTTAYGDETAQKQQIVLHGQNAAPPEAPSKEGYSFSGWKTTDKGGGAFDFSAQITEKSSVYAGWTRNAVTEYIIQATAEDGGSIFPEGNVAVEANGTQAFEIVPDEGFHIKAVTVDGTDKTAELTDSAVSRAAREQSDVSRYYTFYNVNEDHTIHAAFEADNGGNGSGGGTGGNGGSEGGGTGGNGGGEGGGTGGNGGSEGGGTDGNGGSEGGGTDGNGGSESGSVSESGSSDDTDSAFVSLNNIDSADAPASENNSSNVIGDGVSSGTSSKDTEPRTSEDSHLQIYATVAMIAALAYLLLYIMEQGRGMTEEEKEELVSSMVSRAKNENCLKRYRILPLIFIVLLYYHAIGKRAGAAWREREV